MVRIKVISILLLFLFPLTAFADDSQIESAESAAFPALATKATIMDWNGNVLRKGTNGWTCLPDKDTPGNDPWCVNDPWINFLNALKNKTKPSYTQVGIAYMLQGDTPVSNSNPYASEVTSDDDWVTDLGPHLMILIPDIKSYESYPTDWRQRGPWIMWKDTPYVHLMIPLGNVGK
ncbi:MAG: hypothetical protein ABFS45_27505 [Pseudomonadota bacterium]